MSEPSPPQTLSVPFQSLVNLAVEQWRLSVWLATHGSGAGAGPARHAARKLEEFFRQNNLDVQVLDGRPFDPGLAVRVVDSVQDDMLPPGKAVIAETLSPMVLWRGQVVRPAEVVTRQGPG